MVLAIATSLEEGLTVQDRLRLHLDSFGEREIPITIEELAKQMRMPGPSVYQALNRLRQNREIDIEKEPLPNGRDKIVGIKINKLEPSGRTYRRAADRLGSRYTQARIPDLQLLPSPSQEADQLPPLPLTIEYLNKKLAVEKLRAQAIESGLDSKTVAFTENPLAEEAIMILKVYSDLRNEYNKLKNDMQMLTFDLEAEKRNVENYKNRLRTETTEDLLAHAGR